jgi:hypothetical protein
MTWQSETLFGTLYSMRLGNRDEIFFGCDGEGECTSESSRGQFSIFGAIEEILGHGFGRIFTD